MSTLQNLTPSRLKNEVTKLLDAGLQCHTQAITAFFVAKERFFSAGEFFAGAKQQAPRGEWENQVIDYIDFITPKLANGKKGEPPLTLRTVRNYIAFYTELIDVARRDNPKLSDAKLREAALQTALDTPGTYIEVLEACRLLRDPHGYDAAAHQRKKLITGAGAGQMEFPFDTFSKLLTKITNFVDHLGAASKPEELDASIEATRKILAQLEARKASVTVDVKPAPPGIENAFNNIQAVSPAASGLISLPEAKSQVEQTIHALVHGNNVTIIDEPTSLTDDQIAQVLSAPRQEAELDVLEAGGEVFIIRRDKDMQFFAYLGENTYVIDPLQAMQFDSFNRAQAAIAKYDLGYDSHMVTTLSAVLKNETNP